jgi:hypothetical protein
MKMIKIALLATAALTAVSMSARADDLSDLKAQIAALNAQVAATADVPAAGPTITWSGNVKAGLTYRDKTAGAGPAATNNIGATPNVALGAIDAAVFTYSDIRAKWGLKVVATNDTAVGEVGVRVAFAGNADGGIGGYNGGSSVGGDGFWGWWKITPELTLGAGRDGTLAGNGEGTDHLSANYAGGDYNGGYGIGDIAQMRLSYSSGPISAAIAVEDSYNYAPATSDFGVAGEIKYAGDSFGVELNAGSQQDTAPFENSWTVNAGAHVALGDMGMLSAAAGMGSGYNTNDDYTKASAFVSLNLGDSAHAEMGVSHKWNTQLLNTNSDVTSVAAGVYYTPVSQLTIGLEGDYASSTNLGKQTTAALVTVFKF